MPSPSLQGGGVERAALPLALLAVLLPFEPRRLAVDVLGVQFTLLEAVAGLSILVLAWWTRRQLVDLLRRPPLPVAALVAFAAAHLLAASLAPSDRGAALKFAVRMAAMAALAIVVSVLPTRAVHQAAMALIAGGLIVAALALGEGLGWRGLDPLLGMFREMPFNVGGVRRASAGSEYPNLAAACLMYAWIFAVGLLGRSRRFLVPLLLSLPFALALLFTYSRGALVATAAGLVTLVLFSGGRIAWRLPAAALAVLVCAFGVFSARAEAFQLRLESEGVGSWYGAAYEPEALQMALRPGEGTLTSVRVTNTGRRTWRVDGAFHLSYHWYDPLGQTLSDGDRTDLPKDLAPGESASLTVEVRAPRREGRYLLIWDMVQEHTAWFSGQGVAPAVVPAVVSKSVPAAPVTAIPVTARPVTAAPVPATTAPAVATGASAPVIATPASAASSGVGPLPKPWRPGRAELWRLAVDLWRERPLVGFGSDSFRRLYGKRAGHLFWDTRVFANNTFLETAATTGTLGFMTLAGTLAAAIFGAAGLRKSGTPEQRALAVTLLAVVVAVATHGMVDYVLAFTGHYLLLGLVVGAIAGLQRQARAAA